MIAISTACKEALIGIELEDKAIFKSLDSNCKHSENILFTIDQMLDEIGETITNNTEYAVVVGPGSFTGIRIGISLIKGLCAGNHEKNVVPLTTFDLLAYSYIKNFAPKEDFTCIINGLSGYYFICKYSCNGEKLTDEKMVTKEDIFQMKNLVGLEEEGIGEIQTTPTSKQLVQLAKEKIEKGKKCSAQEIVPLYLRKSQAECCLENKK